MEKPRSLGIRRIESLLYYVHDLERMRTFFIDKLDFAEIGASTPQLDEEGRQHSVAGVLPGRLHDDADEVERTEGDV